MSLETGGIDLGHLGNEEDGGTRLQAQALIPFQVPRVVGKIFFGTELGGVHENGYDSRVAPGGALPDEGPVALVQEAHGRDEADALALLTEGPEENPQISDGTHNAHGQE
jgi:hypothetical protein